jgi:hypothetical protein
MNLAKTPFSREIFAGAMISMAEISRRYGIDYSNATS